MQTKIKGFVNWVIYLRLSMSFQNRYILVIVVGAVYKLKSGFRLFNIWC